MNKICAQGNMRNIQSIIYLILSFKRSSEGRGLLKPNKQGDEGRRVLILVIGDNVIIYVSMKSCLSSGTSKNYQKFQHLLKTSLILLANTTTLTLQSTIQGNLSCTSFLHCWATDPTLTKYHGACQKFLRKSKVKILNNY